jgi:hypothetical protein
MSFEQLAVQLGIGGFGMFLMYKVLFYVLKNGFEEIKDGQERLARLIERIAKKL